jgi:DNA-binding transcriptional LysR family regulator
MGQIEDLRLFVSVVEAGGIARAADQMNIAKSAVSRRLVQLEDRYGVRLIARQPRVWEVTSAGQELYHRALRMVADAEELDADFSPAKRSLSGPLTVSVPREFGHLYLGPALVDFVRDHPEIDLTVDFDDRLVDLDRENYDLAVRITHAEFPGLIDRRIGSSRYGLFASRAYAKQHGLPTTLKHLSAHPLLHHGTARRAQWRFLCEGKPSSVEFSPALNSNSGRFLLDAAMAGLGIARLPDFILAGAPSDTDLIPVLPDIGIPDLGIFVSYSANRRLNRRIRALIDVLARSCGH